MKIISFDTEDDSNGHINLCVFFDGENYTVLDIKDFDGQRSLKEAAVTYIYNSSVNIFFAHNLEYDLNNIFYPYHLSYLEMYYSGKLLFARLKDTRKKFLDSFNFSFASLKKVGEQIGVEKMDTDDFYNVEYCKRDTEIVYTYMDNFIINTKDEFNMRIRSTLAGTAQNIFLKNFDTYKVGGENVFEELLQAYFGGRTEAFILGEINKTIFELDINSSYPSSMKNFEYPVSGFYFSVEPETELFISKVSLKLKNVNYPVLPYREELLYFPTGELKNIYVTSPELKKAFELNQIENIEYIKTYNFPETAFIFSEFVDYFYTEREKAKNEGNVFKSNFYKLILNSTYGRFALQNNLKVLSDEDPEIKTKQNYFERFDLSYLDTNFNDDKSKNYIIPVFITAYSRVLLYELLEKVLDVTGVPIYCDTDSIYCFFEDGLISENLQKIYDGIEINNKLGNYSCEVYKSGVFTGAKSYILERFNDDFKTKCKGIPGSKRYEFLTTGKTSYKRPMKLRSSLRSIDEIPANKWYEFFIERTGEYKKRQIIRGNDLPYNLTCPVKMGN